MNRDDALLLGLASERTDETTSALIEMVIGTVLMQIRDGKGGNDITPFVEMSPGDMDLMHQNYEVTREELPNGRTRFCLVYRAVPHESLRIDRDPTLAAIPSEPQAEIKEHDLPYWFATIGGIRQRYDSKEAAQVMVQAAMPDLLPQVENRACRNVDCPSAAHVVDCFLCTGQRK